VGDRVWRAEWRAAMVSEVVRNVCTCTFDVVKTVNNTGRYIWRICAKGSETGLCGVNDAKD